MTNKISAVICAAGKGERAGFGKNKLLTPLDGAPALWHTLNKFNIPEISEVIVISSKADFKEISALCKPFGYKVVTGGNTRTESVKKALKAVTGEIVLIHDGARPYVKKELILSCIASVENFGSGVCATAFTDTAVTAELGIVADYIPRDSAYRLQTPQGFYTADIKRAYALAKGKTYTDDSAVFCEFIAPANLVKGDVSNIKLTYKQDFQGSIPKIEAFGEFRIGFGADVHAFGEGNCVTLGGVKIDCDKGLVAHSDGDVIIHALMDALLSASGLYDIGRYFPDNDENYAGADSKELLKKVISLIGNEGYSPANIAVTVQAEKPRLSPHIDEMKSTLAEICKVQTKDVAISAGTCEKTGFVGSELGITAYAVVTVTAKKEVKNG